MSSPLAYPLFQSSPVSADRKPRIGHYLLLLYLFLLLSRMPEITDAILHTSFYQVFIVSGLLTIAMLFTGTVFNALHTRAGKYVLVLHLWLVVACLFSYWHSGSLDAMLYILRYLPMVFFMGAFIRDVDQLRRACVALSLALVVVLVWAWVSPADDATRLAIEGGSFANSNEIAIYLSVGGPFLLYIAASKRFRGPIRAAAAVAVLVSIYQMLRTGSRGGLVTIAALAAVCFFSVRIFAKLKLAVAAVVLAAFVAVVIPSVTWTRFSTIFQDNAADVTGAVSSTDARRALLFQSLAMTAEHPLFGVGPGAYAAAAADRSKENGEPASWQVTHNAYTQYSAESGIPGLVLFFLVLASIAKSAFSMRRRCRRTPGGEDEALLAGCILLSLLAFCVNCLFASIGTDFYFYMVCGFGIATATMNQLAVNTVAAAPLPVLAAPRDFEPVLAPAEPPVQTRFGSALQRRLEQRKVRPQR